MSNINFIYTNNISAHNQERRNVLFHTPIETVFEHANISYSQYSIEDCLTKQIKGCLYITSDLCRLLNDSEFYECFEKLFCEKVHNALKQKLLHIVIFDASSLRESESSSRYIFRLKNFLIKKNINSENCSIVSNNAVFSPYKIVTWELFEHAIYLLFQTQNININLEQKIESLPKYRFLCLNAKPRFHRYLLMFSLFKACRDFNQQFNYSLRSITITDMVKNLKRYQKDLFYEFIDSKKLLKMLPFLKLLPAYIKEEGPIPNTLLWCQVASLKESLNNSCINIVTETTLTYSGRIFLTEKTFRPIAAKMPFIICGQPGCLSKLHELGYRTFSNFWDESYDKEQNAVKRVEMIVNCVKRLSEMTDKEMSQLLYDTKEIVEYNYNHLFTKRVNHELNKLKLAVMGSK